MEPKSDSNSNGFSRRRFLAKTIAVSGSFLASGAYAKQLLAQSPNNASVDLTVLQKSIQGKVVQKGDPEFDTFVYGELWNKLVPKRAPQVVVRVNNEQDVVEAVRFAKANKLKVVVRGGGHNWCSPSLRNGGMMIDLTNLNKVISIDPLARKAVVQPIISNREIQAHLNAHGMSYPSGHCPPVKLSGYLLGGGMAWNQGVWGTGTESVEAVELVTPDGELITASAEQNNDYYWAARGAGCGLFAVAVRYHLKLYPLPKYITANSYSYPLDQAVPIADWLGQISHRLPNNVELSLFMLKAPPELAAKTKTSAGKICMVTATVFADSEEEARSAVKLLDECPSMSKCMAKVTNEHVNFEKLFDMSGSLWQADRRNHVEAMFSNSNAGKLFAAVKDHFLKVPSPESIIMFAFFTGPSVPAPLPDAAFSMSARLYGGPWTMWTEAKDDEANSKWHKKCIELLKPFVHGHYIGESDTITYPAHIKGAFLPRNYERLQKLRQKHDPDGVFFSFAEGLN
ncbi:MAG: FAD-binding oxidoreductase [Candidatus Obscuribacterales bacterium]|nr:FAD-binding oxidoreductase [Candidatus Obscuribacterales bacterium]